MPAKKKAVQPVKRRRAKHGPGLTIGEAAERLDLSRRAVEKLIAEGRLPVVQLGIKKRIPLSSVDQIIAEMGTLDRGQESRGR
jgi:excisionase family DNA binding protein